MGVESSLREVRMWSELPVEVVDLGPASTFKRSSDWYMDGVVCLDN